MNSPLKTIDEFVHFRDFLVSLKTHYTASLTSIITSLSPSERRSLKTSLYIHRIRILDKDECRKLLKIRRSHEYAGIL